jgi:hypothetical protein
MSTPSKRKRGTVSPTTSDPMIELKRVVDTVGLERIDSLLSSAPTAPASPVESPGNVSATYSGLSPTTRSLLSLSPTLSPIHCSPSPSSGRSVSEVSFTEDPAHQEGASLLERYGATRQVRGRRTYAESPEFFGHVGTELVTETQRAAWVVRPHAPSPSPADAARMPRCMCPRSPHTYALNSEGLSCMALVGCRYSSSSASFQSSEQSAPPSLKSAKSTRRTCSGVPGNSTRGITLTKTMDGYRLQV